MKAKVHLTVGRIENVNLTEGCSLLVEIGWIGRERKIRFPGNRVKKNCTSVQSIQDGGFVRWNEEFEHSAKLQRTNQEGFKSWFINLEVKEIDSDTRTKVAIAPKARIDLAEDLVLGAKRVIRLSLDIKIRGDSITAILEVKLEITPEDLSLSRRSLSLSKTTSFRLFSCIGGKHLRRYSHDARPIERINGFTSHELSIRPRNQPTEGSSSEDEPNLSYRQIRYCNLLINQFKYDEGCSIYEGEYSPDVELSSSSFDRRQPENQSPILQRLLSMKGLLSFKKSDQPKGKPLLNKSCCDIGGDDIDIERHEESGVSYSSRRRKVHPEETFGDDDDPFEVGSWEQRSIFSRDLELELVTNAFLGTIDQRSERASGGSACTVLAVVIADWLYKHSAYLPNRCELDKLVREGSILWRDLCRDESHKVRFSDQHFDLETVLKEGIRPLVVDSFHVGFFGREELQESMVVLKDLPSFDSIWDDMILKDHGLGEHVYICSWNDHFFVLKVERDAIYLIDTFGERLFEGCNQAYILKFDKDSVIYREKNSSFVKIIGGGKLNSHNEPKEGKTNNQENGSPKLEENTITQEDVNINSNSVEELIKIEQEEINHSLTNGAIFEEIKISKKKIERNELEPPIPKEENCEGAESSNKEIEGDEEKEIIHCEGVESSNKEIERDEETKIIHCEEVEISNKEVERDEEEKNIHCEGVEISNKEVERDEEKETIHYEEGESSKEIICEGIEACREYIKGFLASLPLRQLQEDLIMSGSIPEETLHRRLQIEFHFVVPVPCSMQ